MAEKPKDDEKTKKAPEAANNTVDLTPEIDESQVTEELLDGDLSDLEEHAENIRLCLEDLNAAQRNQKKLVMRRYKSKIKNARKRALARRATTGVAKQRARRMAISSVKQKMYKGGNYQKAPASEKNRIERVVRRRKAIIDRLSNKLIRNVRANERKRLQNNSVELTGSQLTEFFNTVYDVVEKD